MDKRSFARRLLSTDGRHWLFEDYLCRTSQDFVARYGITRALVEDCFGKRRLYGTQFVDDFVSGLLNVDAVLPKPYATWQTWEEASRRIGGKKLEPLSEKPETVSRYEPTVLKRHKYVPTVEAICRRHRLPRTTIKELNRDYSLSEIMDGEWKHEGDLATFVPKESVRLDYLTFTASDYD